MFGRQKGAAEASWQTGKSWLGLRGETVLLGAELVAEAADDVAAALAIVVDTTEPEARVLGKATAKVVVLPSLRVLTARAAVGWEEADEDVVESLLAKGPADTPRRAPDNAKRAAEAELIRMVKLE